MRPHIQGAPGSGMWVQVLQFVQMVSIITNIWLYVNNPEVSMYPVINSDISRYTIFFVCVMLVQSLAALLRAIVSETPQDVKCHIVRQELVEATLVMRGAIDDDDADFKTD